MNIICRHAYVEGGVQGVGFARARLAKPGACSCQAGCAIWPMAVLRSCSRVRRALYIHWPSGSNADLQVLA